MKKQDAAQRGNSRIEAVSQVRNEGQSESEVNPKQHSVRGGRQGAIVSLEDAYEILALAARVDLAARKAAAMLDNLCFQLHISVNHHPSDSLMRQNVREMDQEAFLLGKDLTSRASGLLSSLETYQVEALRACQKAAHR